MMKPIYRPELGQLSAYNETSLRVIAEDMELEIESLDPSHPQFRQVSREIKRQIGRVRKELSRKMRIMVLPSWQTHEVVA